MTGKNRVLMLLVGALAFGFVAFLNAEGENDEQSAITAKAAELVKDDMPEPARIMALHRFVRDEIRQVKTQYG